MPITGRLELIKIIVLIKCVDCEDGRGEGWEWEEGEVLPVLWWGECVWEGDNWPVLWLKIIMYKLAPLKVNVTLHRKTGRLEHHGIKIEFIGQIELYYDRGNHHEFLSLVKSRPSHKFSSNFGFVGEGACKAWWVDSKHKLWFWVQPSWETLRVLHWGQCQIKVGVRCLGFCSVADLS